MNGTKEPGQKVAVIGGGLTGCEIAYDLALKGKEPMIVEMTDDLVKAVGICAANSECLRDLVRFHKIPVYLESTLKEIRDGSILISTAEGTREIACDSVILSVGYVPDQSLYRPKADAKKGGKADGDTHIHVLGDAQAVGNLKKAIWGAYDLGVRL